MVILFSVITAIISYLIGSLNAGIIITKCMGSDIRQHGSGNAGATNMLRTYGKKLALFTLLIDALKGVIAILITIYFVSPAVSGIAGCDMSFLKYISGTAVVIGHNYPVYFGFKGGKGVATSGAVILMLDYRLGLIAVVVALLVMATTKYVSLGSVIGAVATLTGAIIFGLSDCIDNNAVYIASFAVLSLLAIYRHKENIVRLINKTESKLSFKK